MNSCRTNTIQATAIAIAVTFGHPPANMATELNPILPKEPAEALKTIKTAAGFHAELVAAEPLVRDPIAIAFDENGRMFVVEFPEYNHRHAGWTVPRHGSVRMLEDTDGDGRFDRSTVYADELASPTAVACYDGGLLVAAAPDILFLKDSDGDGRAEVRRVLFTGFGISEDRGGGGRLNSLRWGLDHRFHLCTSFSGGDVRRADDPQSATVELRNRGFAFDPRTLEFTATSGSGQHGLATDDAGRQFTCNNSDPFRLLMYPSRYLARNPHVEAPAEMLSIAAGGKFTRLYRISPDEPWRVVRTQRRTQGRYRGSNEGGSPSGFFTAATGVTVYRGNAWPEEYRGNIFVGEVSNNLVHRAVLEERGVELVAHRADAEREFLASSDNWFRPVELANAPDGTLYVVDMYRELIETALALPPDVLKQLKQGAGVDRGRIYRIVPEGFRQPLPTRLGHATTDLLVATIEHRNGWHRDTASRLLYERQDRAAVTPLRALVARSTLPEARMTALYCLDAIDALDTDTLAGALDDPTAVVRAAAVRLAEQQAATSPRLREKLFSMTDDPDLLVRYQLAFSLGECSPRDETGAVALRPKRDSGVRPAAGAVDDLNTALAQLARQDAGDRWTRFAILSSLDSGADQVFASLISETGFRRRADGREFLLALARQIGAAGRKAELAAVVQRIDGLPPAERPLVHAVVRALFARQNPAKRKQMLAHFGNPARRLVDELLDAAKPTAADRKAPLAERTVAIRSLGLDVYPGVGELLSSLLDLRQPPTARAAALETLAEFDDGAVAAVILRHWPALSPDLRSRSTEVLLSRRAWVAALLDAVEEGRVSRADLGPAHLNQLQNYSHEPIRQRAGELFQAASSTREEVIERYRPALQLAGDPARGKIVFEKVCAACHKLDGIGTAVGAELTAVRDHSREALLLSVLDPNREVKPKFLSYVLASRDGRVITGMLQSENANSVTIRRADGTTVTIARPEIEQLRSAGMSFMPEGLESEMDPRAMADLLEYLSPQSQE